MRLTLDSALRRFSLHPAEITTAGTDAFLSGVSAILAARLFRLSPSPAARAFARGLAGAAVAAGGGSLFHGLRAVAPDVVLWLVWRLVPLGIAVTNAGVLLGVLSAYCSARARRRVVPIVHAKLAVVVGLSWVGNGLAIAGVDLGVTVAALLGFALPAWVGRLAGAPLVAAGAATTATGLLVQLSGLRHGLPWNHNDAFHLMQVVAFSLFFAAARRMTPSVREATPEVRVVAPPAVREREGADTPEGTSDGRAAA